MASFVEQATLQVKDQSSAQIKKINAALKQLAATAKSLKSVKIDVKASDAGVKRMTTALRQLRKEAAAVKSTRIDIRANTGNVRQASTAVKGLTRDLRALRSTGSATRVNVNTGAISRARQQLAALRSAARRPINVNTTGGGAGGGGGGGRPRGPAVQPGGGAPRGPGALNRLGTAAGGVLIHGTVNLANASLHALGQAVMHSTKEGYKDVDIAQSKMAFRQMSPEDQKAASVAIDQIQEQQRQSPSGMFFNRAATESLYAESLSVTNNNIDAAKDLMNQTISLARQGRALGQTYEQSQEGALDFIKAGEQMGKLTNLKTGQYDPEKAGHFFDAMRQIQYQVGREFTGKTWRSMVQNMGAAKYGMDTKGMMGAALLYEEMGTRAGVGIQTALKNLTGNVLVKKKVKNLTDMGLLTEGESKVGRVGDKDIMEIVGKGAKDETELRSNFVGWVSQTLFPAMKAKLGPNWDPTSAVGAGQAAEMITSGKGTDIMAGVIKNIAQLQQAIAQGMERKGDIKTEEGVTSKSGIVAAEGVRVEMQDLMGQLANKAEGATLPVMRTMSASMSEMSDKIATGQATPMDYLKTLGTGGAAFAGLGLAASFRAMANPQTAPMGTAALALTGSATALTGAASALTGAAAVQAGGWGKLGSMLGIGGMLAWHGIGEDVKTDIKNSPTGLPSKGSAGDFWGFFSSMREKYKDDEIVWQSENAKREAETARNLAAQRLKAMEDADKRIDDKKARGEPLLAPGDKLHEQMRFDLDNEEDKLRGTIAALDASIASLGDKIKEAKDRQAAAATPGAPMPGGSAPIQLPPVNVDAAEPPKVDTMNVDRILPGRVDSKFDWDTVPKYDKVVPTPRARPKDFGAGPEGKPVDYTGWALIPKDDLSNLKDIPLEFKNVLTPFGTIMGQVMEHFKGGAIPGVPTPGEGGAAQASPEFTPLTDAISSFQSATGEFASVFAEGGSAIIQSGTLAADAITSGAEGAGAAYGSAAVAKIQSAVANLNVNVNVNGAGGKGGADKGSQTATSQTA